MDKTVYPEFREASHDKFARNRDTLRFLLEGMASSILNYDQEARVQSQLDRAKEMLHDDWESEASEESLTLKST